MAHENYTLFNLDGSVNYIDKIENGYPVVEIHEFCCNSTNSDKKYNINSMIEGHTYDKTTQEPDILIRNLSFYCDQHHPTNF